MIIEVPGMGMQNHNSPDCSVKRGVVFGGSLSFELSFQPLSTFMVSAMGAVAMAAGEPATTATPAKNRSA